MSRAAAAALVWMLAGVSSRNARARTSSPDLGTVRSRSAIERRPKKIRRGRAPTAVQVPKIAGRTMQGAEEAKTAHPYGVRGKEGRPVRSGRSIQRIERLDLL